MLVKNDDILVKGLIEKIWRIFKGLKEGQSNFKIWIPGKILSSLLFWSLKIRPGVQKLWYFQVSIGVGGENEEGEEGEEGEEEKDEEGRRMRESRRKRPE